MVLAAHLKNDHGAGLSIAYYDTTDGSVLGSAGWTNWDNVVLPVGVCLSRQVDGLHDAYTATCPFTIANDDHDTHNSHLGECAVNLPQLRVAEGCYMPPPRRLST